MTDGMKLKVCGLRDNVQEVAKLCPDYVGFIFYKKSPRYVGDRFTAPKMSSTIKKVGVFVNESIENVIEIVRKYQLDYVQLHGEESVQYCRECQKEGFGVIKAFGIGEGFDFKQLTPFKSVVDFFLFDTKTASYGGSGKTFNWKLLQNYDLKKEYFLSGGISLKNLSELGKIDLEKVHALDVNSRFEIEPGLKDPKMILQFQSELKTHQPAIIEKSK